MMTDRDYLSIGEVLALLLEEFPDVTISKIRFLESQGLIEPERTPSGYRKFTDSEVERLRFILREQKANYLPLRVIKDKLEDESQDISRDIEMSDVTTSLISISRLMS
jgi:DNA-binding transcriptional MerR regulator